MMVRQGDILLKKIRKLPNKSKLLKTKILLEGEATGHAHRIENGNIYQYPEFGQSSLYVEARKGTRLVHDEHNPIDLKPGIYEFIRQREYDPDEKTFHWVED